MSTISCLALTSSGIPHTHLAVHILVLIVQAAVQTISSLRTCNRLIRAHGIILLFILGYLAPVSVTSLPCSALWPSPPSFPSHQHTLRQEPFQQSLFLALSWLSSWPLQPTRFSKLWDPAQMLWLGMVHRTQFHNCSVDRLVRLYYKAGVHKSLKNPLPWQV
jgi:hypothetical protein